MKEQQYLMIHRLLMEAASVSLADIIVHYEIVFFAA